MKEIHINSMSIKEVEETSFFMLFNKKIKTYILCLEYSKGG